MGTIKTQQNHVKCKHSKKNVAFRFCFLLLSSWDFFVCSVEKHSVQTNHLILQTKIIPFNKLVAALWHWNVLFQLKETITWRKKYIFKQKCCISSKFIYFVVEKGSSMLGIHMIPYKLMKVMIELNPYGQKSRIRSVRVILWWESVPAYPRRM